MDLRTLRRNLGAGHGSCLSADLQRGLSLRNNHLSGVDRVDEIETARLFGAEVLSEGVLLIEDRVSLRARQGLWPLSEVLSTRGSLPENIDNPTAETLVFLDTETSGLSQGAGTLVFLIGLARVMGEELVIRQYLLTRLSSERRLLEEAISWLDGVGAFVTFNGKSFDIPLLKGRCNITGLGEACFDLAHLDLLHPLRRAFAASWSDHRLQTAEKLLLGVRRTDDLPGSEAPQAWRDFIGTGQARNLKRVIEHNRLDLLSLVVLLPALEQAYSESTAALNARAVVTAYLKRGGEERAFQFLDNHRDELGPEGLLELARLLKRRGRLRDACTIWTGLVREGSEAAVEQLAIYYEHREGNYDRALSYARMLPREPAHEQRRRRLLRKLFRRGAGSR